MALVCAHFLVAYRAWQASRGEEFSDIDPDYVRIEDYFARSFRSKLTEWLRLPVQATEPGGIRIIRKGHELIRVSGALEHPCRSRLDDIQVVRGAFRCGPGCTFTREIYAYADASIGAETRLQAIAADGNLTLGAGVRVARWVDCVGDLEVGTNSVVGARATAGKLVRLCRGAQVGSAYAPVVSTALLDDTGDAGMPELPTPTLAWPAPVAGTAPGGRSAGLDAKRLSPLGPDCWLYSGDLKPSVALRLNAKLVVKGNCFMPAGSVLEGDLKAHGRIVLGAHSVCMGNVISGRNIWFGPASRFRGVVHAGKELRLSAGVRGGTADARVAAFASERLALEEDVTVHGKLASADRVVVLPDPRARRRRKT